MTQKKAARDRERVAGCDASGFPTATYYFGEGFCMHSPDTVTKIEARDLLGPFHHPKGGSELSCQEDGLEDDW